MPSQPLQNIPTQSTPNATDKILTVLSSGVARLTPVTALGGGGSVDLSGYVQKASANTISALHTFTNGLKIGEYTISIGATKPTASVSDKYIWLDTASEILFMSIGSSYYGLQESAIRQTANAASATTDHPFALAGYWGNPSIGTYLDRLQCDWTNYTAYAAGTAQWSAEVATYTTTGSTKTTVASRVFVPPGASNWATSTDAINAPLTTAAGVAMVTLVRTGSPGNLKGHATLIVRPYIA